MSNEFLKEKLAANCSIDIDNNYYELINGELVKKVHVVVTAQTKALLFQPLSEFAENYYGKNVPIFSSPLVAANTSFDSFIRNATQKA